MGDDIGGLIRHLDLEKSDVMGYSLGGGTALFTALTYPELVDRLVLVSVYLRQDGSTLPCARSRSRWAR